MFMKLGKTEWVLMILLKKHAMYSNVYTIAEYHQLFSDCNTGNAVGMTAR